MKMQFILVLALVAFIAALNSGLERYREKQARAEYSRCQLTIKGVALRLVLHHLQNGSYPEKLTPEFYSCNEEVGSLHYERSADGENWVLYCPGEQHASLGIEPDTPRNWSPGAPKELVESSRRDHSLCCD